MTIYIYIYIYIYSAGVNPKQCGGPEKKKARRAPTLPGTKSTKVRGGAEFSWGSKRRQPLGGGTWGPIDPADAHDAQLQNRYPHNTNPRHPAAGLTLNPKPPLNPVFLLILPPGGLTARTVAVGNLRRPREAGIRAKPQREHRNATEFRRNHSGSVETKTSSHRCARRCRRQPKSPPPQKRPEEATRGRNSRETTAGASKCNGICAKPQREHRNATEFARNHSGSVETKAPSHRRARRCGQRPIPLL